MAERLPSNFSWLIPDLIAGCGVPRSEDQLRALEGLGITLLVSLSSEAQPPSAINSLQIRSLLVPIAISQGASRSVLAGAVAHIQTEIASGGRVAVHCKGGNGRTGMVLAAFIMKSANMSAKKAISFVRSCRPQSIETNNEVESLKIFENIAWLSFKRGH